MPLFTNATKEKRPDTVSRDYLTAFAVGPVALNDPSQGLALKPWRIRLDGNDAKVCSGEGGVWGPETTLFTIAGGAEVLEIDIAFTQNADPIIAYSRADNSVWLYWYDPTLPGFTQTQFDAGRTPRVVLDDLYNTETADVQLFYVSDVRDRVVYRQQRDRYAVVYDTPVVEVADKYLEDVVRGGNNRLHIIGSVRNRITGRYTFWVQSSTLFGYKTDPDGVEAPVHELQAIGLRIAIYEVTLEPEGLDATANSVVSIEFEFVTMDYEAFGEVEESGTVLYVDLWDVIMLGFLEPDGVDPTNSIVSVVFRDLIIRGYMTPEGVDPTNSINSLTLVVP